jgi:hypothetical protein
MFPLHRYILLWQERKTQFPLIARPSPPAYGRSRMKRVEMPNCPTQSPRVSYFQSARTHVKQTHKSIAAAASSAVPGRARGIVEKTFGSETPVDVGAFAPGIPRATFLPPISIVSPSSFAAVNLHVIGSVGSSSRDVFTHRVRMYPNAMVLARTPKAPHSCAMVLVKPTMADLAAA